MNKPRILYIAPCWPHARASGTHLRALHLARALQQVGEVQLCVLDRFEPDPALLRKTRDEFQVDSIAKLESAPAPGLQRRLRESFDPRRMNLNGFVVEPAAKTRLLERLPYYDLIWLHHLSVSNMFNQWHWPRSVLDIDDLPSTYERAIFHSHMNPPTRLRAGLRFLLSSRREKLLGQRFTTLAVCSEDDRRQLGAIAPIHVIPNGFERPTTDPKRTLLPASPRIGFIGFLDYAPNREGVHWFLKECWPQIKREIPNAHFRVAGKGGESVKRENAADVDVLGWVEDPAAEIATWSAMIVPVKLGAGTRVKIADAFSRKCPVVSTTIGAFGYEVANGRELFFADRASDFAEACVKLMRNPIEAAMMAERAWERFLNEWTWDAIAPRVWAAAEDCLQRSAVSQLAGRRS